MESGTAWNFEATIHGNGTIWNAVRLDPSFVNYTVGTMYLLHLYLLEKNQNEFSI